MSTYQDGGSRGSSITSYNSETSIWRAFAILIRVDRVISLVSLCQMALTVSYWISASLDNRVLLMPLLSAICRILRRCIRYSCSHEIWGYSTTGKETCQ